jgi:hypothetical protein
MMGRKDWDQASSRSDSHCPSRRAWMWRGCEAPALTRPNRSAISLRQDHSCSLDHLVGAREYSSLILIRRYRQARVTHGADVASGFPFSTT